MRATVTLSAASLVFCLFAGASAQSGSVLSDLADPQLRARYRQEAIERIKCAPLSDTSDKVAVFDEASTHKWDRVRMGCAVTYGAEALEDLSLPTNLFWAWITFRAQNIERHLIVLGAHLEYFDVLNKSYSDHYQGIELVSELSVRWAQNLARAQRIVDRIEPLVAKLTEARILRAAFLLASTQRESTVEQQNAAVAAAMADLEVAVQENPEALDGLGLLLLGQVLVTLPEMLGGDAMRGITLLEKAHAQNPTDLAVHRALVEAYLGEREKDKAVALLGHALTVDANAENPQDYVDDTKFLGGIADRLGKSDLVAAFRSRRDAVLASHTNLLTRKQTAAFGHGGENPLTGEHADDLQ